MTPELVNLLAVCLYEVGCLHLHGWHPTNSSIDGLAVPADPQTDVSATNCIDWARRALAWLRGP